MPSIIVKVTDNMLIGAIRRLYQNGDIDIHGYGACLRRYKERKEKPEVF